MFLRFQIKEDISDKMNSIVNITFDSDSDNYIVKYNLDTVYAGASGASPFKLRFTPNSLKNNDKHKIKLEMYSKDGKRLAGNSLELTSLADVPKIRDNIGFSPIVLKKKPINGKIDEKQIEKLLITEANYWYDLDIRKSKLVVEMPHGLVPSDPGKWKKIDGEKNKYERIFDNASTHDSVSADISKIDHYTENMLLSVKYTKYVQKLNEPDEWELVNTAKYEQKIVLPPDKPEIPETSKTARADISVTSRLLNENLDTLQEAGNLSLPFVKEEMKKLYIAQHHKWQYHLLIGY